MSWVPKRMVRKLIGSENSLTFLRLSSSATISQAVPFLMLPLYLAIYGPESYGVLLNFTALQLVLAAIMGFRFQAGIVAAKDDKKALNLLNLSIASALMIAICAMILIGILNLISYDLNLIKKLGWFSTLIPLAAFADVVLYGMQSWRTRTGEFKIISQSTFLRTVIGVVTTVLCGLILDDFKGLAIASIVNVLSAILILAKFSSSSRIYLSLSNLEWRRGIKENRNILKFEFPIFLLNSLSFYLFVMYATYTLTNLEAGYFAIALRIWNAPSLVFAGAFIQMLYLKMSMRFNSGHKLYQFFSRQMLRFALLISFSYLTISIVLLATSELMLNMDSNKIFRYSFSLILWSCGIILINISQPIFLLLNKFGFSLISSLLHAFALFGIVSPLNRMEFSDEVTLKLMGASFLFVGLIKHIFIFHNLRNTTIL